MTSRTRGSNAYHLAWFVALSVLSGLLVAGLALPAAFLGGSLAKAGASSLESLPAELEIGPQSERSKVLMSDGSTLAEFYSENRVYVPLSKIAPIMQQAQIAIEDDRFYEHGAIDFRGTARAALRSASGSTQGGSTLTQQYVKQVQIEAAATAGDEEGVVKAQEQTLARKVRELRFAVATEKKLTKDQILERYLNIAYYGDGAYGVEAAARHYFGTTAAKLTLPQAAMLAGLVQNPVATDPVNNPNAALNRRTIVLNRMAELKRITPAQAAAAKKVPFDKSKVTKAPNDCNSSPFQTLCLYVKNVLLSDQFKTLGKTKEERLNTLKRGGLTIKTLIDPKAQAAAERSVARVIAPTDPFISTAVLIQPKTGLIVSMAQNRTKIGTGPGQTWYNYAVDVKNGGAEGFQAGSTFKAFTVAAALQRGITPSRRYNAQAKMNFSGTTFRSCKGPFTVGDFPVKNSTNTHGSMNMRKATEMSVNTYFIPLERDAGLCNTVKMAKAVGVERADGKDLIDDPAPGANGGYDNIASFTLGPVEVTPLSMASAYATFANRGVRCDPIIIESVTTKAGKKVAVPSANCKKVIEPEIADGVNSILKGVINNGTGRRAHLNDNRDQAAKTGTTDSAEAVWLAGYTPDMAGVTMIAADKQAPQYKGRERRSITGRRANGTDGPRWLEGSGSGDAGIIWKGAMTEALKSVKTPGKFGKPTDEVLEGKKAEIPDISGMNMKDAIAAVEAVGFGTEVVRQHSERSEGAYLYAYPSRGSYPLGQTVQFYVSKGPRPYIPVPTKKPTQRWTQRPTQQPTKKSTWKPQPTKKATSQPTKKATSQPPKKATAQPTRKASSQPPKKATAQPTVKKTQAKAPAPKPTQKAPAAKPTAKTSA